MKAITLHQPWASLVAAGVKTVETRSWRTSYRGPLAIHAGLRRPRLLERVGAWTVFTGSAPADTTDHIAVSGYHRIPLPLGEIVATCELIDCVRAADVKWAGAGGMVYELPAGWYVGSTVELGTIISERQRPYGDYTQGRWAWLLSDIRPLPEPIPAKGHQQLWQWTP